MNDLLDYAKKMQKTFEESPFNRVDALILSWLSYFCYPDYLKGERTVVLKNAGEEELLPQKEMFAPAFNRKKSKRLFALLQKSRRFGKAELSDYREERDEEQEKQFAALCIRIAPDVYFLSFRGTDPSFLGWKEDFNLAYLHPVPSQRAAAEYFAEQTARYPRGRFYLGGHSKGGTVAAYAALQCGQAQRERICRVFSFDGPALLGDQNGENSGPSSDGFFDEKYEKIIPRSSFVGMLFETRGDLPLVKSRNFSFLQHDPFSWRVKGLDFVGAKRRSKCSVRLERAINTWLEEMTLPERERAVNLVYGALNTLDTKDFDVFFKTLYKQVPALFREHKRLGEDDRAFFDEKIKRLFRLLRGKD